MGPAQTGRQAGRHHPPHSHPIPTLGRGTTEYKSLDRVQSGWPPRAAPADLPRRQAHLGAQLPETEGRQGSRPPFLGMTERLTSAQPLHAHLAGGLDPDRTCLEGHCGHTLASQASKVSETRARMGPPEMGHQPSPHSHASQPGPLLGGKQAQGRTPRGLAFSGPP